MGGAFVNYFNLFGRTWQVYVQAEGEYRTTPENVGQFRVRNAERQAVPLSALMTMRASTGQSSLSALTATGLRRSCVASPGYSTGQAMAALEEVFAETMPREMGYDYTGHVIPGKGGGTRGDRSVVFGLSLMFVFLIMAAQYESWTFRSVFALYADRRFRRISALWALSENNVVYASRPDYADWTRRQECHPHCGVRETGI